MVTVGNLAYRTSWQDLKDYFRESGFNGRADIIPGASGRSSGSGTVTFDTAADAERAVFTMNGALLHGRNITVQLATEQTDVAALVTDKDGGPLLFVSNLPWSVRDAELQQIFEQVGTPVQCFVRMRDDRSQGTAGVRYSTAEETTAAINQFNGMTVGDRVIGVRLDRSPAGIAPRHGAMASGNAAPPMYGATGGAVASDALLFVSNLPWSVGDAELWQIFEQVGTPVQCFVRMRGDRSQGTAGVRYSTAEETTAAINQFNGMAVGDRVIGVRYDQFNGRA